MIDLLAYGFLQIHQNPLIPIHPPILPCMTYSHFKLKLSYKAMHFRLACASDLVSRLQKKTSGQVPPMLHTGMYILTLFLSLHIYKFVFRHHSNI